MCRRGTWLLLVCLLLFSSAAPRVAAQRASGQRGAEALVARYYQILNAGMRSGDFSAMDSVYAPDATLYRSTPQGETVVLHGLSTIIAFYQKTYLAIPGYQWVRDTWYDLSPTIVLNYEHTTGGAQRLPSRCSHLFVLQNGRIHQLFWVVYFAGKR